MLPILLAVTPDQLGSAERAQAMVDKNVYSAAIVGLVFAVVCLFGWLMRVQGKRVADRDATQAKLESALQQMMAVVGENAKSNFVIARTVDDLRGHLDALQGRRRQAPTVPPKEP